MTVVWPGCTLYVTKRKIRWSETPWTRSHVIWNLRVRVQPEARCPHRPPLPEQSITNFLRTPKTTNTTMRLSSTTTTSTISSRTALWITWRHPARRTPGSGTFSRSRPRSCPVRRKSTPPRRPGHNCTRRDTQGSTPAEPPGCLGALLYCSPSFWIWRKSKGQIESVAVYRNHFRQCLTRKGTDLGQMCPLF